MNIKKTLGFFVGLSLILLVVGCENTLTTSQTEEDSASTSSTSATNKLGTVDLSFSESVSRTILPSISMVIASYEVSCIGPDGATLTETTQSDSNITLDNLLNGVWNLTVKAKNLDDALIGSGQTTVTVLSNETISATVIVFPIEGTGSLELNVTWPEESLYQAEIESSLSPVEGQAEELGFTIVGGEASCNLSDIATGYHTLVVKLFDNGILTAGTVEIVRIVAGETTVGNIDFDEINIAEGDIDINIEQQMKDPLEVVINGGSETKLVNKNKRLIASVNNCEENIIYVWYVNGSVVETGDTFMFGKEWAIGHYNIDVIAYTANGERAGSARQEIEVIEEEEISGTIGYVIISFN